MYALKELDAYSLRYGYAKGFSRKVSGLAYGYFNLRCIQRSPVN